ncbi:Clp protease N-terminal domain-containing protein [Cryptosporangium aurantiacum]|uniref:Clp amino terminal domain-containing protein, pathogenicity island component n=1 Tax=Cryptosporangium aurantiacum TaxID=134849 RepID=A0A1M7RBW3_9ACTN|nr:Clp protease N-terminal domain-containing protein [Cryptosporangium aurantiacum]SHN43706.1 Clp amino terminal domain-containing protein, pathogenicity island component [Cryptosporangium aurantiacum]
MFERFTPRARRVLALATEEARDLEHAHLGTEHLLLGLILEDAHAVDALGLSADDVRQRVEAIVGFGEGTPRGHRPFTAGAKAALRLADEASRALGHDVVGPQHLLLGLLREREGVAARVLAAACAGPAPAGAAPAGAESAGPESAGAELAGAEPAGSGLVGEDAFEDLARRVARKLVQDDERARDFEVR